MAVFSRNRWQLSAGMAGKFQRIGWQVCGGIYTGLLDKRITWSERDTHSLNATLTVNDLSVNGVFYFDDKGLINRFETKRYFESNGKYTLEDWSAILDSYSTFDGILLPSKGRVIWNLKEGDFEYFNFEVVDYKRD